MDEKPEITPAPEDKKEAPEAPQEQPKEEPKETPKEEPKEQPQEKPIGEVLDTPTKEVKKEKPESVPLDVFINMKKELKEEIRSLKDSPSENLNDLDLTDISRKYGVDENFLAAYAAAVENKVAAKFEEKYESKFTAIEAKDKQEKINKAFNKGFKSAMANMPEYKGVVNPTVIKTLSLQEGNKNKTFTQLITETYSSALPGKATIAQTKPGGQETPKTLDFDKSQKDSKYLAEILKDPDLKKEYNKQLLEKGQF